MKQEGTVFTQQQTNDVLDHLATEHGVGLWHDASYDEATTWHMAAHQSRADGFWLALKELALKTDGQR